MEADHTVERLEAMDSAVSPPSLLICSARFLKQQYFDQLVWL